MKNIRTTFFGDRTFYKKILALAIPMMLQNGITNFVGFLDNIMIGQLGTDQMSGVSIVNQMFFVFALCVFGAASGVGIFVAQFYGQGNKKGIGQAFRFKHYVVIVITILGIFSLLQFGETFINLFLHEGSQTGDLTNTLNFAKEYLLIIVIACVPFAISQVYASTLREIGKTIVPMIASSIAVVINLALNYVLIFGKFGFPELGVKGAAVATVTSRIIEALVIIIWTHTHTKDYPFLIGVYRTFEVPVKLMINMSKKGLPLLANEALWSLGMTALLQTYSFRGLAIVGGLNISNTIANVFNIVFIALGDTVAIIVGQLLGANKMEEAVETDRKIITFSVLTCIGVGAILATSAPVFPSLYNTSDEVRTLATSFIRTTGIFMPLHGFLHATYFTLRAGGKSWITILFDSVYVWVIAIPLAFILVRYTSLPITIVYVLVALADIIKCIIGFILVKKKVWVNNIVANP